MSLPCPRIAQIALVALTTAALAISTPGCASDTTDEGEEDYSEATWSHECGQQGGRHLLVDRITWKGGWPAINNGTPSRGRHTAPLSQ